MYTSAESIKLVVACCQRLKQKRHRALMLLSGEEHWIRQYIKQLLIPLQPLQISWFGNEPVNTQSGLELDNASALLGSEVDLVVIDVRSGFDPDALALLSGVVKAGGLLLMLTPDWEVWPQIHDPQCQRIAVHPLSGEQISRRFLQRLIHCLQQETDLIKVVLNDSGDVTEQHLPAFLTDSAAVPQGEPSLNTEDFGLNLEQQQVVDELVRIASRRSWRPMVLTADRGRGKSHALGTAAARLIEKGYRIIFTGPHQQAVSVAQAVCAGHIQNQESAAFLPADRVLSMDPDAIDILLVDEAAALSLPILQRLAMLFPRLVLVTTIHGYEGTGRSFGLRFFKWLDKHRAGWKPLHLTRPVRWSQGDPLERLAWKLLLLDAELPLYEAEEASQAPLPEQAQVQELAREKLWQNEDLLRLVFALLIQAHYRTRPFDLWHLLDGPNLRVLILTATGRVLGIALLAEEGPLDQDLLEQVFAGKRRVRGHLLPQSLVREVPPERLSGRHMLRIMRLAVHPDYQRQGYGRRLLAGVEAFASKSGSGVSLLGVSYGASPELLNFWQQCGYTAVQLATRRQGSSGEYAVLMVRSLMPDVPVKQWRTDFYRRMVRLLPDAFRDADSDLIAYLFTEDGTDRSVLPRLTELQCRQLRAFAWQSRGYEDTRAALIDFAHLLLQSGQLGHLQPVNRMLVIGRLLQCRDWNELKNLTGLDGKSEIIDRLRCLIRQFETLIEASPVCGSRTVNEDLR